jgi:hypothetical protein
MNLPVVPGCWTDDKITGRVIQRVFINVMHDGSWWQWLTKRMLSYQAMLRNILPVHGQVSMTFRANPSASIRRED